MTARTAQGDPEATFRRAVRKALHQMWRDIPAYQYRVASDITAAEDTCVDTIMAEARTFAKAQGVSQASLFGEGAA